MRAGLSSACRSDLSLAPSSVRPMTMRASLRLVGLPERARLHAFRHSLATVLDYRGTGRPQNGSGDSASCVVRHHDAHLHACTIRRKAEAEAVVLDVLSARLP